MDPVKQVLVIIEEVRELILAKLSVIELLSKSRVCRCWQQTVYKILQKRSRHFAIDSKLLTCSRNHYYYHNNDEDYATTSSRSTGSKRLKLAEKDDCQFFEIKRAFLKWRAQWLQAPKIILLFCKSVKATGDDFSKMSKQIFELFQNYVPKDCVLVMLRGSMCCRFSELNFTLRTEALNFLSSRSNCINTMIWTSLRTDRAKKRLLAAIKEFTFCQNDLKILMFFYDISKHAVGNWINNGFLNFLKNDLELKEDVVILGCAVHDSAGFLHSRNCSNKMVSLVNSEFKFARPERIPNVEGGQFFAIAINGSSIFSASLLVDFEVRTISELSSKMKLLKESTLPLQKDNSFGVIVSCIDRMHDAFWYDDYEHCNDNVEIMAFQEEFPEMPILTMHSFGEIGQNFNVIKAPLEKQLSHTGAALFSIVRFND